MSRGSEKSLPLKFNELHHAYEKGALCANTARMAKRIGDPPVLALGESLRRDRRPCDVPALCGPGSYAETVVSQRRGEARHEGE